jgi:predicted lipoprotein with Yx(FWY)xxD motif
LIIVQQYSEVRATSRAASPRIRALLLSNRDVRPDVGGTTKRSIAVMNRVTDPIGPTLRGRSIQLEYFKGESFVSIRSQVKSRSLPVLVILTLSALAGVALAACSGSYSNASTTTPGTAATSEPTVKGATDGAAGTATIKVDEKADLGAFLIGPDGRTLYVFTRDVPDTSNCSSDCLSTWPPLLQKEDQPAKGDASANGSFGYIDTPAGEQVTYNSAPLYYFSGDSQPGDTNGNLIGGVWFVARPDTASTAVVGVKGSGNTALLVGPTGKTLYFFAKDTAGMSNCTGQCVENWPALTVPQGLDPMVSTAVGALDVIAGADTSTLQVTYDGRPLYYFAGDSVPGDTKGDGIGGVWTVARPS